MDEDEWNIEYENEAFDELEEIILLQKDTASSSHLISPEDEERVFVLCKNFPSLVEMGNFDYQDREGSVLQFLIEHGASLGTIQAICHLVPSAVRAQKLPLHVACECVHTQPGVIRYLVKKYPLAATERFIFGEYPIHILLQRENVLEDVEALVQANPPLTVSDQRDLLNVALKGPSTQNVLEFIVNKCPKINSLKADQLKYLSKDHAVALSRLLPQLKVLRFRSKEVNLNGWVECLMASLGDCESIQRLHLDFRQMQLLQQQRGVPPDTMTIVSNALNSALSRMPNLLDLTLLGRRGGPWAGPLNDGISTRTADRIISTTEALVTLLGRNTLQAVNIDHFQLDHEAIFDALKNTNESLRRMIIVSIVDDEQKRKALAEVLLFNTSLQSVSLRSYGGDSNTYGKIEYLTKLNQMGRRFARDPQTNVKLFVSFLHEAQVRHNYSSRDSDHNAQLTRAQLLYGLLRECPSLWS